MSPSSSLTSIIADLGILAEQQLGEVQARQVIYGGDEETNLLELGVISEEDLLQAIARRANFPAAPSGYLPIDITLSKRLHEVDAGVVGGFDADGRAVVFASAPLDDALTSRLKEAAGRELWFQAAPRLRIAEGLAAMDLGKLTVRETGLLDGLGPRPAEAPLFTGPEEEQAPESDAPTAVPPEVMEVAPEPAVVTPPPPPSEPIREREEAPLRTAAARATSLESRSPVIVETGPPPQGYAEITAASLHPRPEAKGGRSGPRAKYSAAEAIADLTGAKTRDRAIDVLVHYAAQFFEYTAVFAVLSKTAKGLSSSGSGAGTAAVKKLNIPLDLPSAFQKAQHSTAPQVTRLKASGIEGGIARDLDRPTGREILLLPIGVRGRSVLLLWGDKGKEGVDYEGVSELLAFAPTVSQTLERVLLEHKRASRVAQPMDRLSGIPARGPSLAPGLSEAPAPPMSAPPVVPTPVPVMEAPPVASRPSTERNPAAPAAQPPNVGEGHQVAQARKRTLSQSHAPDERTPDGQSEPPMAFPAETPKTIRGFPRVESPKEVIKQFEPEAPAPQANKPSMRPPLRSRRIVPLDSVVRIQSDPPMEPDEPVEVPHIAPPPPPSISSFASNPDDDDRPRHSSRGTLMSRRPPVSEPSESGWESPPAPAVRGPGEAVAPPRGKSSAELVRQLLAGDESVIHRLVEGGETAVGALIAEFPGPIKEPKDASVPASECGPILKALVALGSKATPFLTVRTADEDAKVRRWATFVLGELQGKDAAKAIAGRLLDDSADVRRAALISARRARKDVLTRRTLRSQMEELCRDQSLSSESRTSAIEALADIREHEAIPILLQLLEDRDSGVVRATRWALSVLTRQDFGTDREAWRRFWQENRDLDRVEWLISSLAHEQRDLRRAAGDELKAMAGESFGFSEDSPEPERRSAQAEFRRWWTTEGKASRT